VRLLLEEYYCCILTVVFHGDRSFYLRATICLYTVKRTLGIGVCLTRGMSTQMFVCV
jgi:hypothetical protein